MSKASSSPWMNMSNRDQRDLGGEVGDTFAAVDTDPGAAAAWDLLEAPQSGGLFDQVHGGGSQPYRIDVRQTPNPSAPGGRTWAIRQIFGS